MDDRYARTFKDLIAYKKTKAVSRKIFKLSNRFPKGERYSLTDQIRRSARSIGGQIAEAWGKRRYEKHFVSKLTDADSEQLETQHWVDESHDCGYLNEVDTAQLNADLEEVGRLLNGMIEKAASFCPPSKRAHKQ